MGLVHSRRGIGVKVTEHAAALCREQTRAMVQAHLRDAVAQCVAAGLTEAEVHKVVAAALGSGALPYAPYAY